MLKGRHGQQPGMQRRQAAIVLQRQLGPVQVAPQEVRNLFVICESLRRAVPPMAR
jgi:hypothetical protein